MKAPDKIYIPLYPNYDLDGFHLADEWMYEPHKEVENVEYIRKDALLDYLQKELERLWELIPDASNETPNQMEMRYLGEYMATERIIDEIKLL